ncbi:MAG: sigma-70 family RNA polymerase sigma factor [Bacteroidaceae bacterium]|nr:sigma-70 family RNA polymerase sigma factor [Bacteroidaceae bacterium]
MEEPRFTSLVTHLRPMLIGQAMGLLHNEEEAADAVQDALVALWRMGDRVEEEGDARRLAARIARNICLNKLKHRQRHGCLPLDELPTDTVRSLTARQRDPQATLEQREQERRVQRAMAALPLHYQALLTMRHIDGMSHAQIAAIQGTTEMATRTMASRAKAALIKALKL